MPPIIDPDDVGPAIGFLKVPEGKTAKNRMHIDIRPAGKVPQDLAEREQLIRAKVTELVAAGATRVREELYGEDLGHVVMLDPKATSSASGDGVRAGPSDRRPATGDLRRLSGRGDRVPE